MTISALARSAARTLDPEAQEDRRRRILDAAERCFVRAGFHRTTMQDIAAEAGMSPGNLYRYFDAKDAVAAGIAERDRATLGEDFVGLADAPDLLAAFGHLARKHFVEQPREKAVLCLEIWAEATRNAAFAAMTAEFERDILARLSDLIGRAQARGEVAASVDAEALALLVVTLANGLFVKRAIAPGFDAEGEVRSLNAVVEAAFAGRIELARTSGEPSRNAVEENA